MTSKANALRRSFHALNWNKKVFVVATLIALLASWIFLPSGSLIRKDALENLVAAYNLSHHGVISMDATGQKLEPSLKREPLPIIVLAGYMSALQPWIGERDIASLREGPYARLLKYSNLIWGLLVVGVIALTAGYLTRSWTVACGAIWCSQIGLAGEYDTLLSEMAAAGLLALGSLALLHAIRTQRSSSYAGAGLCFGLLCLTKAAFFYIFIVLLVLLLGTALLRRTKPLQRIAVKHVCLIAVGIAVVVLPWMTRNYVQLQSFSIAGRGGQILLLRAYKDLMSAEEYRGSFYVYAPVGVKQAIGVLAGYSKQDLAEGGPLQRLNRRLGSPSPASGQPDNSLVPISFFEQVNAVYLALLKKHAGPNAEVLAGAEAQQQALSIMREHPWRHIALSLPFLWRGAPYAALIFAAFLFVFGWRQRDNAMVWYVMPSIGLLGFYASLTHFLPRYSDPVIPIAAICFFVLLHQLRKTRQPS